MADQEMSGGWVRTAAGAAVGGLRAVLSKRVVAVIGVLIAIVAVIGGTVAFWPSSTKSIDNTAVGGTLGVDRLQDVLGHLFDGVSTVHVQFASTSGVSQADVVCGPPVQARIALGGAPKQAGTIVIKDGATYLHQDSFGAKWVLLASSDDGVSGAPTFCDQTNFELTYLGPHTTATYIGPQTVAGASVREYELVAPIATGSASPTASAAAPDGTPQKVATVWIDDSGRLIQYQYSPAGVGSGWVTATYSNWNAPVTITAPAQKDIQVVSGTM